MGPVELALQQEGAAANDDVVAVIQSACMLLYAALDTFCDFPQCLLPGGLLISTQVCRYL
ncbi:hypothetical protein AAE485_13750 [Acidithiobacillus ferriphilus]|uniref:hypothetical protein n=1 Tax=Acidithiobacillus ferriphilus TaxID=1689834 RepID=UPI002324A9CF|nr:hypothetical protein [Acidithiobacillus sp.]